MVSGLLIDDCLSIHDYDAAGFHQHGPSPWMLRQRGGAFRPSVEAKTCLIDTSHVTQDHGHLGFFSLTGRQHATSDIEFKPIPALGN
jgi:hypothetical protein